MRIKDFDLVVFLFYIFRVVFLPAQPPRTNPSTNMSSFKAGDLLKNRPFWRDAINYYENKGGMVPAVVKDAVESGHFDLRHKSFTNFKASNVIFRGEKYESKDQLLAKNFENSSSIQKNLSEVLDEVMKLDNCGAVVEISEAEALSEGSVISPILWISQIKSDGSKKNRLIHHDLLNFSYAKPKFSLAKITNEVERIAEFEELWKCDKEKCFYCWG